MTNGIRRPASLPTSTYVIAGLFAAALIAFWPRYLSRLPVGPDAYTHVHAILMSVWMALLIAQPILMRTGRRSLHRQLGRITYALVPAIVVSAVLLSHVRFREMDAATFAAEGRFLYLPLSMTLLFVVAYALGVRHRDRPALHCRYMLSTALALIDPVVARLQFQYLGLYENLLVYQAVSFVITDIALAVLIALDRRRGQANAAFPVMLAVCVVIQAAWFTIGQSMPWMTFCRWFVELPLS